MKIPDEDTISRLAAALLELEPGLEHRHGERVFSVIEEKLNSLTLQIICSESVTKSVSDQAAVLTAINVGKRCFKGGVSVSLPENIRLLLPWHKKQTLNESIIEL